MSNKNKSTGTTGVSMTGVLLIVFIIFKLLDIIHWSWIWVLSPLWISWGITLIVIIIIFLWETYLNK